MGGGHAGRCGGEGNQILDLLIYGGLCGQALGWRGGRPSRSSQAETHRRAELEPYDSTQKPGRSSKTFMPLLSNGSQTGGEMRRERNREGLSEAHSNLGGRLAPPKPGPSASHCPGQPAILCSWKCAGVEKAPPCKMCI